MLLSLVTNLIKYASKLNLKNNENFKKILSNLFKAPFIIQNEPNFLDIIFEKNKNINKDLLEEYKIYFGSNWKPYFKNGFLNYCYLLKKERSNSYIRITIEY